MSRKYLEQRLAEGVALQRAGSLAEAEHIYQKILVEMPNHADALHLLGVMASQTARYEQACELIGRAIALSPGTASYHRNLGTAFRHRGMTDRAIAEWQRAIALAPNSPDLWNSLGTALQELKRTAEAVVCFRRAISFDRNYAHAHYNLGCVLEEKAEIAPAITSYEKVLELKPDYAEANNNLARIWKDKGQLDRAIACYREAIRHKPQMMDAYQNLLFVLLYHPASTNQSLADELRIWSHQFSRPLEQLIKPFLIERNPDRRLKIGYVSPDFRSHVVARFYITNLLTYRDREGFEIFCYAQVPVHDEVTTKLRNLSDHWCTIVGLSDEQVADRVRADGVDILIDLALHTGGNRLLVFAQKPAPVQMTMGGYPGSTGLKTIDCRLTDPYLDPPGFGDEFHAEKTIRMPDTFWCDPEMEIEPAVGPLPALTNGYITFGSLNNFCKVNDELLWHWAQILANVPNSQFILLAPSADARKKVLDVMSGQGIDETRVQCLGFQKRAEYLATHNRIDIGLDTWPFNGHSTSVDSFWMGVPVVTWVGLTVVGRAGVSQLINLNLPELIGQTPENFHRIAIELAHDLPRLGELRRTMRERMRQSPLMNPKRFVRGIEVIYRNQWREWCARETATET